MSCERLDREVHVLLDLRRVLQRVRARHPHALVQRDADAVRELLQRHRSVFVVVVHREGLRHVGRRIAGTQLLDASVHGVVDLAVQVDFLAGHLHPVGAGALEAAHEVDEIARGADGIDVDDDQVALADELVGRPPPVRTGVAAGGDDDVVDDLAAALEHELVDFRLDFTLAHARLEPFVLDLPHRRVADARGLLQQLDLVARLDDTRPRYRRPAVDDVHAELLEGLEGGHVEVVDADLFLLDAVLLEHLHHAVGHAASHERYRALGPLPGNRRTDATGHPGQVDDRALHVGARGLEQRRLTGGRHHGVADVDVVFPVALVGGGRVADVGAGEQHQGAEVVGFHLRLELDQPLLPQAIEIDPVLPVGAGLAVQPTWIVLVRLAEPAQVHAIALRRVENCFAH